MIRSFTLTGLFVLCIFMASAQSEKIVTISRAATLTLSELPESFDARVTNIQQQPHPAAGTELLKQQLNTERLNKQGKPAPQYKTQTTNGASAPQLLTLFQANIASGVPNDNHIAISNTDTIVSVVNSNMRVYNGTGGLLFTRGLSALSSALGNYSSISDPHITYDPVANRFIIVYFNGSLASNSTVIIGFSKTSDPTGAWNFYKLPGNPYNDSSWSDYPYVAITKDEFFISFNLLKDGQLDWRKAQKQSIIWQIDKQKGYNGDSLVTKLWGDIQYNGTYIKNICLVQPGSGAQGTGVYAVAVRQLDLKNDTVFMMHIENTIKSGAASLTTRVLRQDAQYGLPPNVPMQNKNYLQTNDGRILSAVIENNMIHYVQNTIDTNYNTCGVYYGRIINPQNSIPTLHGTIIRSDTMDYAYPSVAWAGGGLTDNSVMITCSHCSKNVKPGTSVYFVDRNGAISPQVRCKDGEGWVNALADTNERWGDYTGIQRKYNEPGVVWLTGSYSDPTNYAYRSWITKVKSMDASLGTSVIRPNEVAGASVYPNTSALGRITIEFTLAQKQPVSVDLFDMNGKLLQHIYDDACKAGINRFECNTSMLPKGIYIVSITSSGLPIATKQVVVE